VQTPEELPKQHDYIKGLAAASFTPQRCPRTSTAIWLAATPIDAIVIVVVAVVEQLR
jgi:hypothetical protein